eukprot:2345730-Rhodomonas_salina.2
MTLVATRRRLVRCDKARQGSTRLDKARQGYDDRQHYGVTMTALRVLGPGPADGARQPKECHGSRTSRLPPRVEPHCSRTRRSSFPLRSSAPELAEPPLQDAPDSTPTPTLSSSSVGVGACCNTEIGAAVSGVRRSAPPPRPRRQYPNRLKARDGGHIATRLVT